MRSAVCRMTEEENIVNMPKIGTVVMSTYINKCLYAQFKEKKDNNVEMERERESERWKERKKARRNNNNKNIPK